MNRTELIEAGARNTTVSADDVARIIEDVEPLIRADERERERGRVDNLVSLAQHVSQLRANDRADLRAKVEALPCETDSPNQNDVVEREYVLALFDGSNDE